MKKIFVSDSYHTNNIARELKEFYGEKVEIITDDSKLPQYATFSNAQNAQAIIDSKTTESGAPKFESETSNENIDLFFFSAQLIRQRSINPKSYKERYGNENSKVVAMSSMDSFMREVLNGNYGVDLTFSKDFLHHGLSEDDKVNLLNFLND
jgi:hypothetical protein